MGCSCDWDSGWRATPLMYAAKIRPTPIAEPIAARPYPIMFNEPCSSIVFLSRCLAGRLWRVPGGDPMGTGTRKFSQGDFSPFRFTAVNREVFIFGCAQSELKAIAR